MHRSLLLYFRKGEHVTPWTLSSLCLLLVGGLVFMIAFMTNGWGRLTITEEGQDVDYWEFGLWQCCRVSDNSCIGPRWPSMKLVLAYKPQNLTLVDLCLLLQKTSSKQILWILQLVRLEEPKMCCFFSVYSFKHTFP